MCVRDDVKLLGFRNDVKLRLGSKMTLNYPFSNINQQSPCTHDIRSSVPTRKMCFFYPTSFHHHQHPHKALRSTGCSTPALDIAKTPLQSAATCWSLNCLIWFPLAQQGDALDATQSLVSLDYTRHHIGHNLQRVPVMITKSV